MSPEFLIFDLPHGMMLQPWKTQDGPMIHWRVYFNPEAYPELIAFLNTVAASANVQYEEFKAKQEAPTPKIKPGESSIAKRLLDAAKASGKKEE